MTTLWDTDGAGIVHALAEERAQAGGMGSEPPLTLIAVCEEADAETVRDDVAEAAAYHPCRLLTVVRRNPTAEERRIDAEIGIGGRYGPVETVVLRLSGETTQHAASVVLPLLATASSVHLLWLLPPPDHLGGDPLAQLSDRRTTDCTLAPDPRHGLDARAADYHDGDTDLSWARLTDLRGLLATTVEACPCRPANIRVAGDPEDPSARLLSGWLSSRLEVPSELQPAEESSGIAGTSIRSVAFDLDDGTPVGVRMTATGRIKVNVGERHREVSVGERTRAGLLAEELNRGEVDVTYAETLMAAVAGA